MGRKKNVRESFSDRASFIVGMFREQPERKFTLKGLADRKSVVRERV